MREPRNRNSHKTHRNGPCDLLSVEEIKLLIDDLVGYKERGLVVQTTFGNILCNQSFKIESVFLGK